VRRSSRRALGCAFIGRGGGEATAEVMAINGHGGFKTIKSGLLIRETEED
jgi:hypothetical protein